MKAVEALRAGHPDKICDQIADSLVDEYLRRDPESRVDIKILGSHGMMMIGGEVNSIADFDVAAMAKQIYKEIGYQDEIEVFVNLENSSEEMKKVHGSFDTVIINGYATRETREFLPRPVVFAQSLVRRLDDLQRLDPAFYWLGPDGKVQIIMEGKKVSAVTILVSHLPEVNQLEMQTKILERVVGPVFGSDNIRVLINPIGLFTSFGFQADTGVSGRHTAADFYGGLIPHGDTSPVGKDPYRAERAGAYMARYVAKQLVVRGLTEAALVSLIYTLGQNEPSLVEVKATSSEKDLLGYIKENFNFNLEKIVEQFDLKKPRYRSVSVYGQVGREGIPWE